MCWRSIPADASHTKWIIVAAFRRLRQKEKPTQCERFKRFRIRARLPSERSGSVVVVYYLLIVIRLRKVSTSPYYTEFRKAFRNLKTTSSSKNFLILQLEISTKFVISSPNHSFPRRCNIVFRINVLHIHSSLVTISHLSLS